MNQMTEYDLSKHLAIEQIKHYQELKQTAAAIADKVEYRRCVDQVDILVAEYGLKQGKDGNYE